MSHPNASMVASRGSRGGGRLGQVGAACILLLLAFPCANFLAIEEVQHPLDRGGDLLFLPIRIVMEPLTSFVSAVLLWPLRFHFRVQAMRLGAANAPGRSVDLPQVLRHASEQSCQTLQQLFRADAMAFGRMSCPETVLIRSSQVRVSILPSRFGRRKVLLATDSLVSQLSDLELRFVLGREMGRSWLRHTDFLRPWVLQHFVRDVVLFPLNVLGYRQRSTLRERPTSQSFKKWMVLRRWVDGVANACDAYRGLRSGTWPGLSDLDLDHFWRPVTLPSSVSYGPVDAAAALCARLRAPGGVSALGTAAVGSVAPKLAAVVLSLSPEEERQLMRFTRLGTWALGLWSAKARAEVFSADRLGFLAAEGDLDAALRAMVLAAQRPEDVATATLLGSSELVKQAEYLASVLPATYWSRSPSLFARVADLSSWVRSPTARAALQM